MESGVLQRGVVILAGLLTACLPVVADYGISPITSNTLAQWETDRATTPDYELPVGYTGTPRNVSREISGGTPSRIGRMLVPMPGVTNSVRPCSA